MGHGSAVYWVTFRLRKPLIWITTEEASEFLRKSSHAVRQMVYKGQITARKFHGKLYFNRLELNELIDSSHY